MKEQQLVATKKDVKEQPIKCVIWDLDHTIWDGTLLENDDLRLRPGIVETIQELDRRGILHSIASRNDYDAAMARLTELDLQDYFLHPEISWRSKSDSVAAIAKSLNIGIDTLAFIDDQPFEREEVAFVYPDVLTIDAQEITSLLDQPRFKPRYITAESQLRRQMYQQDSARQKAEDAFVGPNEAFLTTLQMVLFIRQAGEEDLQRAEELTMRTNQLNSTGYTYSYAELDALRQSDDHLLLVASLDDTFGTYGTIGLALVEKGRDVWTVKLLLMSCRVMSRGVGSIMMSYIMQQAKAAGAKLQAYFIPNGRNRMMYITYKFGGFREIAQKEGLTIFEHDLSKLQPFPSYVDVQIICR